MQPPTAMEGMVEPVTYYKPSIAIAGLIFYTGQTSPMWQGQFPPGALAGMQLTRHPVQPAGAGSGSAKAMLTELRQKMAGCSSGAPMGLFIYARTDMPDAAVLKLGAGWNFDTASPGLLSRSSRDFGRPAAAWAASPRPPSRTYDSARHRP